jgi:transposase
MTLGNLREQGVQHLIAYCHDDACRHQALIDVSSYPGDTPVPWFQSKVKCGKCARRGPAIKRTGIP